MKLLIDTNVILDVLLRREPFAEAATDVLNLTRREDIREYVSASAITDIYYIANRQMKDSTAVKDILKRLSQIFLNYLVDISMFFSYTIRGWVCQPLFFIFLESANASRRSLQADSRREYSLVLPSPH